MGGTPALGARRAASGVLLARNSSGAWTGLVVFARAAERALEPQQSTAKILTIEPHDLGDAPRALRVRSAPAARRVSGPTATRRHVAAATSQSARARKRARESHRVGATTWVSCVCGTVIAPAASQTRGSTIGVSSVA